MNSSFSSDGFFVIDSLEHFGFFPRSYFYLPTHRGCSNNVVRWSSKDRRIRFFCCCLCCLFHSPSFRNTLRRVLFRWSYFFWWVLFFIPPRFRIWFHGLFSTILIFAVVICIPGVLLFEVNQKLIFLLICSGVMFLVGNILQGKSDLEVYLRVWNEGIYCQWSCWALFWIPLQIENSKVLDCPTKIHWHPICPKTNSKIYLQIYKASFLHKTQWNSIDLRARWQKVVFVYIGKATANYPTNLSTTRKLPTYLEHFLWLPLLILSLCLCPPTFSIFIFSWRSMGGRCCSLLLLANRDRADRDSPSFTFFRDLVVLSSG